VPHHVTQRGNRRQFVFCSSADYWSSARAHVTRRDDGLAKVKPLLERVVDWRARFPAGLDPADLEMARRHLRSGRPLGAGTSSSLSKPGPAASRSRASTAGNHVVR